MELTQPELCNLYLEYLKVLLTSLLSGVGGVGESARVSPASTMPGSPVATTPGSPVVKSKSDNETETGEEGQIVEFVARLSNCRAHFASVQGATAFHMIRLLSYCIPPTILRLPFFFCAARSTCTRPFCQPRSTVK